MRRRTFLQCLLTAAALPGCAAAEPQEGAILRARPRPPSRPLAPGRHDLPGAGPSAFVYVPVEQSGALLLMLHGATRALPPAEPFLEEAEQRGITVAVPFAREHTWDLMATGAYGADVPMLDRTLDVLFDGVAVNRLGIAGFSDGASYALSLGLQNAALFSHVIAFSPGFIGPLAKLERNKVFISHGKHDRILPIDATSRRIVQELDERGLGATYYEFEGGHSVPADIRAAALEWFMA